ncbi:MAG: TonB-dependent receptor, partial [Bacteroidetes bacterium]|nr:TonB-dependent receptor [Bacteroidota bacterium]
MKKVSSLLILIFGLMTMSSFAQDSSVLGKVLDDQGEGLPFANVLIESIGIGVATDFDGNYRLAGVPPGTYTIKYTFVGYDSVVKEGVEVKTGTDTRVPDIKMGNTYIGIESLSSIDMKMVRGNLLNLAAIVSIRGSEDAPIAKTNLSSSEIEKLNNGQDLPYMVQNTPSVVVTSDAGAGVGYTGLRIRGSDQTRINVTINGIPYNDPESQGVFWVN